MSLSDYWEVFESLSAITTILYFLSGALVCKQYVVNRTTAETSALPFVSGFLCCCQWFLFGIIKPVFVLLVIVTTVGATLMISYTAVFYIYTFKKSTVSKQFVGAVAFVIFIICHIITADDDEVYFTTLGLTACTFTIITIAVPMSKLPYVVRMKSTKCLPFPIILMSFFVSMMWAIFWITFKNDLFLCVSCLLGVAVSSIQLSLFVIYPSKTHSLRSMQNLIV